MTAKELLRALGMAEDMLDVVSCPFCGRGDPNAGYENIVAGVEELLEKHDINMPVAVMGVKSMDPVKRAMLKSASTWAVKNSQS